MKETVAAHTMILGQKSPTKLTKSPPGFGFGLFSSLQKSTIAEKGQPLELQNSSNTTTPSKIPKPIKIGGPLTPGSQKQKKGGSRENHVLGRPKSKSEVETDTSTYSNSPNPKDKFFKLGQVQGHHDDDNAQLQRGFIAKRNLNLVASSANLVNSAAASQTDKVDCYCIVKSDEEPLEHWEDLAEERLEALQEALKENQILTGKVEMLGADNAELVELIQQSDALTKAVNEMVDDADESGIVNDEEEHDSDSAAVAPSTSHPENPSTTR